MKLWYEEGEERKEEGKLRLRLRVAGMKKGKEGRREMKEAEIKYLNKAKINAGGKNRRANL